MYLTKFTYTKKEEVKDGHVYHPGISLFKNLLTAKEIKKIESSGINWRYSEDGVTTIWCYDKSDKVPPEKFRIMTDKFWELIKEDVDNPKVIEKILKNWKQ